MADRSSQADIQEDAYIGKWVWPETNTPLEMVGRKGRHDIDWIAGYIADLLNVDPSETVLDLCCGNGIVTQSIARRAQHVVGVDFSHILLRQAREISSAPNIIYLEGDARKLGAVLDDQKFDKAFIISSFQYFDEESGRDVLQGIRDALKPGGMLAVIDIPDQALKFRHQVKATLRILMPEKNSSRTESVNKRFHSFRGRMSYLARNVAHAIGLRAGSFGHFWRREDFSRLAASCGFECTTLDQPDGNPMHDYRFDAKLKRKS
jgi:ubiquinone/menaquinone biosynthesis C-methylase UbiE